jgi:hypothetical protein
MINTRFLRATSVAIALLAVPATAAIASPASDHVAGAAASVAAKLDAAAGHVSNADALDAIAAARQRVLDRLAWVAGQTADLTVADAADPAGAAQAGIDKAIEALTSNPTDADAPGLEGLAKASSAITDGLARAQDGLTTAGDARP